MKENDVGVTYFAPGQAILLRELWRGRVWSARPELVVQDTPDLLALFICPGAVFKFPSTPEGGRPTPLTRANCDWQMVDSPWVGQTGCLRLTIPGNDYSVLLFRNDDGSLRGWYINFEDPLIRTARGFDYMDQVLDIIVKPDLLTWHWKDEDELEQCLALGLISPQRARAMHEEGKQVVALLQSGMSIYNGWENWKPDPAWVSPVLPDGWDKV